MTAAGLFCCQMFIQKITFKRHLLELLPFCKFFDFFSTCIKYIPMPNNVKVYHISCQKQLILFMTDIRFPMSL